MNGLRHTDFTAQIVFSVTIRLVYRYHWIVCFGSLDCIGIDVSTLLQKSMNEYTSTWF